DPGRARPGAGQESPPPGPLRERRLIGDPFKNRTAHEPPTRSHSGRTKDPIRDAITDRYGYDLSTPLDAIRLTDTFSSGGAGPVPVAFRASLEAAAPEGAVRRAISVGGDSDTITCTAGRAAGVRGPLPGGRADDRGVISPRSHRRGRILVAIRHHPEESAV